MLSDVLAQKMEKKRKNNYKHLHYPFGKPFREGCFVSQVLLVFKDQQVKCIMISFCESQNKRWPQFLQIFCTINFIFLKNVYKLQKIFNSYHNFLTFIQIKTK